MAASVGWIINEMGIHFPGMISQHPPLTFAELGTGYEAWENVPLAGKLQILAAAGLIEAASEMEKPVRVASARASCGCSDRTAPRFKAVNNGGWAVSTQYFMPFELACHLVGAGSFLLRAG